MCDLALSVPTPTPAIPAPARVPTTCLNQNLRIVAMQQAGTLKGKLKHM